MLCCGTGTGSGSRQYLAQFSKNKTKIAQNLAFLMSEAAYFTESWPLIFDFFLLFLSVNFMLDSDQNPVPEPNPDP